MKSLPLADATRRLGAPANWDHARDGICHTIEIHDHNGWMTSAWQPSALDLEKLNAGAPLYLMIQGSGHPVVSLLVTGGPVDQAVPLVTKAELHGVVHQAVLRALEVGAPGLSEGGRLPIALNAAVRASSEIHQLLISK